jgi:hypothetical protein
MPDEVFRLPPSDQDGGPVVAIDAEFGDRSGRDWSGRKRRALSALASGRFLRRRRRVAWTSRP